MNMKTLLVVIILAGVMLFVVGAITQSNRGKRPVANDSSGLYFKDRFGVYVYIPRNCGFLGCIGPDIRLVKYRKIQHADPDSFQILLPSKGVASSSRTILARDRKHVFYGGEYVPTGDVSTLEVLGEYGKDKNNLYFGGLVIRGIDTGTVKVLGREFIADRNGLYQAVSSPPKQVALVDLPTFKILPRGMSLNGRDYVAEDKNFYYRSDGGTYRADSKPGTKDFKGLGCGYYYFGGKVFYSVYQLKEADAATFRVLTTHETPSPEVDSCHNFYALDKDRRYHFELEVRPDDTYRNRQIDLLLAGPEDKKRMSEIKYTYVCVPEYSPGVNFGYSGVRKESNIPGTIKMQHFFDAHVLESQIINSDGQWQPLPTITQSGLMSGCDSIGVQRFWEGEKKPWFDRRDPTSISLVLNQTGQNPVFVVADSGYSIKLAFSKTSLTQMLRSQLGNSRVTAFDDNVAGWGSGWILEDKFFLSREQVPEVWMPLRIKNVPTTHTEGRDYVTVGFKYRDGQFECVDTNQCSAWNIPQKFKAEFD